MKLFLTGCNGQIGYFLKLQAFAAGWDVISIGRNELDITNHADVFAFINAYKPDVIINAAAYTDVDKAESKALFPLRVGANLYLQ